MRSEKNYAVVIRNTTGRRIPPVPFQPRSRNVEANLTLLHPALFPHSKCRQVLRDAMEHQCQYCCIIDQSASWNKIRHEVNWTHDIEQGRGKRHDCAHREPSVAATLPSFEQSSQQRKVGPETTDHSQDLKESRGYSHLRLLHDVALLDKTNFQKDGTQNTKHLVV